MGYLAATRLNEYRADYAKSNLDNYEHRVSHYGAYEAFKADTPNLLPDHSAIVAGRSDGNRATKVPVINRASYTIGATRTCNVQTKTNVSALVTVTYVTLTAGFHMIPAQYGGNEIAYQQDFNRKMKDWQRDMAAHLDALAVTKFGTIKSAVNSAEDNPYAFTGNTIQVNPGDEDVMFGELQQSMFQNDFKDSINVVSSPRLMALILHNGAQGPSNDENLAYQYSSMKFGFTNRITPSDGCRDSFFMYPDGSIGFLNWNDPDSRMGHESTSGKQWSEEFLPMLDLNMGLIYQSDCGDQTTEAGLGYEASMKESYFFHTDVAFVSAYNSATGTYPSPTFKVDVLKQ